MPLKYFNLTKLKKTMKYTYHLKLYDLLFTMNENMS